MPTFKILLAGAFLLAQLAFDAAAQWPPAPSQKVAVNGLTNKVYMANFDADTVTAFNAVTGSSAVIPVGDGPAFIAVNPATNRVYVNNSRAASISVIDGDTDTLVGTYSVNTSGPIAVNPVTNIMYAVRLTGTGTDEVLYFNGANNAFYAIAVTSHQPIALAVNPVTNQLFIATYATGNVTIIDGTFNPSNDHPATIKRGVWSKPVALAVNAVTNKVFVVTEDSRGPIAVIDPNSPDTQFLLSGEILVPKAVAVNPVTNKAYALFSRELVVIDGATLATTRIPVADAGSGAASLGVNTATNRILVANATGALTVIDGSTNAVIGNSTVPAGTTSVAINAVTGTSYFFDTTLHAVPRAAGEATVANPITTTITPLAGNASGPDATLTLNASSAFSPSALPIRKVYYQLDGTTGPWIAATGTGPYSAPLTGLTPGSHTLHAFAVDGLDAAIATGAQSSPLVGTMASYTFTVTSPKVDPSLSLGSSSNPSTAGTTVTFTASVSGSNGVPTGTVTFRDAATTLCGGVALASGSATCSTSALSVGTHDITAQYSGDASYNPRTSGVLQQQVNSAPPVLRTLTVSRAGAGSGTVTSAPAGIDCGNDCGESYPNATSVTLTATPSSSSDFAGWSGACTGTGACVLTMDAAKTATATFTLKSYTVTPSAGANGALSLATGAQSSPLIGTMASYTFTVTSPKVDPSISLGSSSNPSTAGTTVTFTASVSGPNGVPTGTVTFRDAATTICGGVALASGSATCSTSALSVGTHDITAQYSGDASYNPRTSGVLQQQVNSAPPVLRTLTVSRAGAGSGTVTSAPAGIDCGTDCSENYPNATSVTLTATPSSSSDFAGWSGACTGAGACVLTMDAAKTVTATFALKSYTVTPSAGANGALSPATPQSVVHGATTSFTVTANAGYSIASVTGCGGSLAASTYTTGPITASCTVSATFAAATPSRMANLSTRGKVLTGDEVMIGGFVIGGSASKRVAVVATGPSLAQNGIANPLPNPTLRLVRSSDQAVVATNDDWQSASNAAELSATGFAPAHALEAAILIDLAPGAYTAIVQGAGDGTGVAVIGVYEVDHPENGLVNISTRGKVLTGDDVMIGGFVISGSSSRTVAIVATGPSLAGHGVPGPLTNPSLKLVRSSDQAVIEVNDDWQSGANAAQLAAAGFAPADSREAAIYVTLPPGAYTAIVEGVSGGTGIAVVGVYAVP